VIGAPAACRSAIMARAEPLIRERLVGPAAARGITRRRRGVLKSLLLSQLGCSAIFARAGGPERLH